MQLGFYVNMTECSACLCCVVACKDRNDLSAGVNFRRVHTYEGGLFPEVWAASFSMGCNHCEHPQCAKNCPVAAIKKDPDTGLVVQNKEMCIACGKCVNLCPYGAPAYDPTRDVYEKCDGCISLVRAGGVPTCVAACSTRCMKFGELEQLKSDWAFLEPVNSHKELPDSSLTNPSILIVPHQKLRLEQDLAAPPD